MISPELFANSDSGVAQTALAQHNSPATVRDVDEPLAAADNAVDIPSASIHPLLLNSNAIHHSDLHDDGSQTSMDTDTTLPHASSSIDESERSSRPDAMMRGALMISFQKAIHLRYPHLNVDIGKLRDNFARKLTDAEVHDFMRMGRGVVEDLKRSGKFDEAKRKLAIRAQDDESEARRNRRRIDRSPPLVPVDNPKPANGVDVAPVEPAATPTSQNEVHIFSTGPGTERPSTTVRSSTQQDTPQLYHLNEDVPMSMSLSSQQSPGSPPNSHHNGDNSAPSYANIDSTHTADEQLHLHEPANQDAAKPDDKPSDFVAPQILLAKVGQPIADVSDVSFEIHERLFGAVRRWAQCWKEYE